MRLTQGKPAGIDAQYSGLAKVYDRVLGNALFPVIRRSFERAIGEYRITFHSAADIGCGTGTFLQYLRSCNVPVFGVDRSPEMLRIAAEKNRDHGVKLLQQDITQFKLPTPVDLITCNYDTMNYMLSIAGLKQVLLRCHANLTERGYLIFDMIAGVQNGHGLRRNVITTKMPGVLSKWIAVWNPDKRVSMVNLHIVFKNKTGDYRRMHEVHLQRWYPVSTMDTLLAKSGFHLRGIHDVETFSPATNRTFWVKYIAKKV